MGFWQNYSQKRNDNFRALANEMDLEYTPRDEYGLINLMLDFKLFRRGHSRKIKNILSYKHEQQDFEMLVFDYQYMISAGNSHQRVSQSVFFVQSKKLDLPQFYLRPEDFFQKVAKFFGRQDINFERYPEFSEQYLVQSPEEDRLRQTLNQDFLYFFTVEKKWCLEGLGYYMVFYQNRKRFQKEELKIMIDKGLYLYEVLSSDLV